jgi:DNA processing protein
VVPGPVDTGRSKGGHHLIQDGALLADTPEDILLALGIPVDDQPGLLLPAGGKAADVPAGAAAPPPAGPTPVPSDLSPEEGRLLAHLDLNARHLDEAAVAAGLPAAQATVAATLLEMKGLVRRLPGNLYVRAL